MSGREGTVARLKCLKSNIKMVSQSKGATLATVATKRITGRGCQTARQRVALRDSWICQICGKIALEGEADHVVPLHLGGSNSDANLQWLHEDCHRLKSKSEGKSRVIGGEGKQQ